MLNTQNFLVMETKQKHPHYKPSPAFFRQCLGSVKIPLPLYQTADGDTTTDITLAMKDPFGIPLCVGNSSKEYTFAPNVSKPLCLDPADPTARLRAIEARARMEQVVLEPTIYDDPFAMVQHANNIASKVVNKLTQLNSQSSNTSNNE